MSVGTNIKKERSWVFGYNDWSKMWGVSRLFCNTSKGKLWHLDTKKSNVIRENSSNGNFTEERSLHIVK